MGGNLTPAPLVAVMAALGLWVFTLGCARLPEIHYVRPRNRPAMSMVRMDALEEAATGHPLIPGNKVTLLFDGPRTMDAMCAAIAGARETINLETYLFDQDEVGMRFADLLIQKRRQGLRVNIMYDAVGTLGTPGAFFERMGEAGIRLCAFNPVNPLRRLGRWRINNRDHRKLLIVDGRLGFMGGANISGTYGHGSLFRSKKRRPTTLGWRDTHLMIEGPAVAAMQRLFLDNWVSQEPGGLDATGFFPPEAPAGDKGVRVLGSEPGSDFEVYRAYLLAMNQASRTLHLTSAYFVPDAQMVKALLEAARRGVDVRIILTTLTDSGLVQHASQSFYRELLKGGIRLFQLNSSVLHAKTAVIDGRWSTVGSTNLDMRSFLHNKEINVIVQGADFGREMEDAFQEDEKNSTEVTAAAWERRPRMDRVKEWAARVLEYWL